LKHLWICKAAAVLLKKALIISRDTGTRYERDDQIGQMILCWKYWNILGQL
jgi:hypothetical protein